MVSVPVPKVVFAVNAGGPEYVDAAGIHYEADRLFSSGSFYRTVSIADTTNDILYRSVRFGNFAYAIPLANGDYVVTLKFAETYWTTAGQRLFDVVMEGREVVSNLDLVAEVGPKAAYDVEVPVRVTDGVLNISFHTGRNNAQVSAIVVETLGN